MADILVSLTAGQEHSPSGDRQERVRLLRQQSSQARKEFLDWLLIQDPEADVIPREDTGAIAPVLKISTREDVVSKLFSREERPDVVSAVNRPFEVRVPTPQMSDNPDEPDAPDEL